MKDTYLNTLNSERTVELMFMEEQWPKLKNLKVLDVGGIPTLSHQLNLFQTTCKNNNIDYKICDLRGGHYRGDFTNLYIQEKFDAIIFLSSLEHFPQSTEGDLVYRPKEDIKGFRKALKVLNDNGIIILTVPMGKQRWQEYHQNYNMEGILELTEGSVIEEGYIYTLINDTWTICHKPETIKEILYDNKCHCVGCFKLRKI